MLLYILTIGYLNGWGGLCQTPGNVVGIPPADRRNLTSFSFTLHVLGLTEVGIKMRSALKPSSVHHAHVKKTKPSLRIESMVMAAISNVCRPAETLFSPDAFLSEGDLRGFNPCQSSQPFVHSQFCSFCHV